MSAQIFSTVFLIRIAPITFGRRHPGQAIVLRQAVFFFSTWKIKVCVKPFFGLFFGFFTERNHFSRIVFWIFSRAVQGFHGHFQRFFHGLVDCFHGQIFEDFHGWVFDFHGQIIANIFMFKIFCPRSILGSKKYRFQFVDLLNCKDIEYASEQPTV